mmetsp:Transcript_16111/g.52476  ORF Transcript_16111/g.52476 Transcript_16111/m.52476 type:complete len:205 (-) Transcript_16111:1101-1715(-)
MSMGGAPSGRSARRKRRAGVAVTPSDRGTSLRETSMDATRRRRSCAHSRATASASWRRAAVRSPPHGACTSSSTSAREWRASGSMVDPTRRTTGARLSRGGSSDRSVGGIVPSMTPRTHRSTGAYRALWYASALGSVPATAATPPAAPLEPAATNPSAGVTLPEASTAAEVCAPSPLPASPCRACGEWSASTAVGMRSSGAGKT